MRKSPARREWNNDSDESNLDFFLVFAEIWLIAAKKWAW